MENKNNVVLVFEVASDPHWMKDVVQFPNALSHNLFNKNAVLVTRPNHKQQELSRHIKLHFIGELNKVNHQSFESQNFSKVATDPAWYLDACRRSASIASVLVLYPFYGNPYIGARYFKVRRWAQLKSAFVIIKSDGNLLAQSKYKALLKQRFNDFFKYFFVDAIVCENESIFTQVQKKQPHLKSKLFYLPNCPLQIYINQQVVPYAERPNNFLFIGRGDDKEKGIDLLLNAWMNVAHLIPDWKLLIAGHCSEILIRHWMNKLDRSKAAGTVEWLGPLTPDAKTVVCTSRKESGPIVLSEAILSGCSFIGTNVGEIASVLGNTPGLGHDSAELEAALLAFAKNENTGSLQAEELMKKMKQRSWPEQVRVLANRIRKFNLLVA